MPLIPDLSGNRELALHTRRLTANNVHDTNVVAWNRAIPVVAEPVEKTEYRISPARESALSEITRVIKEYSETISEYKKRLKKHKKEIQKEWEAFKPLDSNEIMTWAREHMPPVIGFSMLKDGAMVDFTACESKFSESYGGPNLHGLGDDERLIIPPMRFFFSYTQRYWLAVPIINGAPRTDIYAHPHARGRDGVCWGSFEFANVSPQADPDWIKTSLTTAREWRKVWGADVLTKPKICQQSILDIYRRSPESFTPIEGLDGNLYSSITQMLAATPRGQGSDRIPTQNPRRINAYDEEDDGYSEDTCSDCGYENCECFRCFYCGTTNAEYEMDDYCYCHDCAHGFCTCHERWVACGVNGCRVCARDDVFCEYYRHCSECQEIMEIEMNRDRTRCRYCSGRGYEIFGMLSNAVRVTSRYSELICPTCNRNGWNNGFRVSQRCTCESNGLFRAIEVWDVYARARERFQQQLGNVLNIPRTLFVSPNTERSCGSLYQRYSRTRCNGTVMSCTCGRNNNRCVRCQFLVRMNARWQEEYRDQRTRYRTTERRRINASDYPGSLG